MFRSWTNGSFSRWALSHLVTVSVLSADPLSAQASESGIWTTQIQSALVAQAPESWFGSESYVSYTAARSDLITLLKRATNRVVVVSSGLTDPVVATRLHSLKLAGKTVLVLLEEASAQSYNSRHTYLLRASVPVYFGPLSKTQLRSPTFIIIDDHVLSLNKALDSKARGRTVLRDAAISPDSLIAAINNSISLTKVELGTGRPPQPKATSGAKASTSRQTVPASRSGIIRLKARTPAVPNDTGPLPRSLPKTTRMEEIQAGNLPSEEPVAPLRRPKDEFLRLESEGDLRAD